MLEQSRSYILVGMLWLGFPTHFAPSFGWSTAFLNTTARCKLIIGRNELTIIVK